MAEVSYQNHDPEASVTGGLRFVSRDMWSSPAESWVRLDSASDKLLYFGDDFCLASTR
jgi:hypothetical protein